MRNRIMIALGTFALVAAGMFIADTGNITAFAQDGGHKGHHGRMGRGFGGGMMLRGLDLTDAQKEQIKTIMESQRAANQQIHEQLRSSQETLHQATANGQFDEAQVREIVSSQERLRTELMVSQFRVKAQIYNILTPEQRQQLQERRGKFEGRRGKRHGDTE